MEKSLFTCPICAAPLERGERAYACPNGHAYDKAREGYVHLLPANKKHSKAPGDDKGMAEARSPRSRGAAQMGQVNRDFSTEPRSFVEGMTGNWASARAGAPAVHPSSSSLPEMPGSVME